MHAVQAGSATKCRAFVSLPHHLSMSLALSMFGGMALPPTPMRRQSIGSPSSRNVRRPTTTPFSDATTAGQGVLEAVGQTCALSECQMARNHALLQSQHCILCTAQWVVRPAAGVCSAAPAIHKHRLNVHRQDRGQPSMQPLMMS